MTRFDAADPAERRRLVADAVTAHRKRASEGAAFEADGHTIEYADRLVRLALDADQRAALDDVLGEFPVFKVKQPETRKAPEGVVFISAIADQKRAADFVEAVFRRVFGLPEDYRLWVSRV